MNVGELKEVLKNFSDEVIIQINVSDFAETIGLTNIGIDRQYNKEDALVFEVSIDEFDSALLFSRDTDA